MKSLDSKLAWMREVQGKVRELHAQGLPADEITLRVLGPEPWSYRLATGGDYSKKNLVLGFLKKPGEGYAYPK